MVRLRSFRVIRGNLAPVDLEFCSLLNGHFCISGRGGGGAIFKVHFFSNGTVSDNTSQRIAKKLIGLNLVLFTFVSFNWRLFTS